MTYKVFIDGMAGTAGLELATLLEAREDIEILKIDEDKRKDIDEKVKFFSEADISFMCLPDESARETISRVPDGCRVIDTSTAHRTAEGWTYGLAEIGLREEIRKADRVSNPGCHATAFILAARPLVENGLIAKDADIAVTSITGYSGGGKKMIAAYEAADKDALLCAPRHYGLGQTHKHLKEMAAVCSLEHAPVFMPIVDDFYSGMAVAVPMSADMLTPGRTIEDVKAAYERLYKGLLVRYVPDADEGGYLSAAALSGSDRMEISVFGNEERFTLVSRFDNLGKGASGAAIQNMNLALGIEPTAGLVL